MRCDCHENGMFARNNNEQNRLPLNRKILIFIGSCVHVAKCERLKRTNNQRQRKISGWKKVCEEAREMLVARRGEGEQMSACLKATRTIYSIGCIGSKIAIRMNEKMRIKSK